MERLLTVGSEEAVARVAGPNGSAPGELGARYERVRTFTTALCQGLELEDMVVQSMPDASPTKWHLAHTTWFFETFVLEPHVPGYRAVRSALTPTCSTPTTSALGERHAAAAARAALAADRGRGAAPTARTSTSACWRSAARHRRWCSSACAAGRARAAPRAAAPGADADRHQARCSVQSAAAGVPARNRPRTAQSRRRQPRTGSAFTERRAPDRPRRRRLLLRQRTAAPPRVPECLRAGLAAGHQRRVPAPSSRRRLPAARAVALRWAGSRVQQSQWSAPLYWEQRDGDLVRCHAGRAWRRSIPTSRSAT